MPRGYVAAKIRANTARRNGDYSQTPGDDLIDIWFGVMKGDDKAAEAELRRRGATNKDFEAWWNALARRYYWDRLV